MQLNSSGILPHGQSNGLSLPSTYIPTLKPNHYYTSRITNNGIQTMDEGELALAPKLEEMEQQEKKNQRCYVSDIYCQVTHINVITASNFISCT